MEAGSSMTPASQFVSVDGLRLHFLDWAGQGMPIVMVHGLASVCHMFDFVAPRLTSLGRVVALDQRGHGESDKPDSGYDFATIVHDLAGFVSAVGIAGPCVLAGHSWGGSVALAFAAAHPDRVRGLVLIDGGFADMQSRFPAWEEAERVLAPPPLTNMTWDDLRRGMREHWLAAAWSPEVEAAALHVFEQDAGGHVRRRLSLANHMQILHALWRFRPSRYFAQVQCPVMLVAPLPAGETPQVSRAAVRKAGDLPPAEAAANAVRQAGMAQVAAAEQSLRRCQVAWFEDTMHDVPWHRPEQLAQAMAGFIQGL